jgi:hypothetical protein
MKRKRSYTFELMDPRELLSRVKQTLKEGGEAWAPIAEVIPLGHVEYKPIRNNPVRSGFQYQYETAGLDLTVYYPEAQFEFLLDVLDRERVMDLKGLFQETLPDRSGYIIREFKIKGIIDEPRPGNRSARGEI